ncbi:MAG: heme biosynthesis HemY N-terminal domain-containing protein [Pseudomonadota bacterium]
MIKLLSLIIIAGLLIAAFGMVVIHEPGFAVFSYGDTTVEIPLIKFYFAVVALFIVIYLILRILGGLFRWPEQRRARVKQRKNLEIMQGLESSILNYSQYQWEDAIKSVTSHIKQSPIKRGQHLFTALCAHHGGQKEMRDAHISSLRNLDESQNLANTLEAEFSLDDGKPDQAISILRNESSDNICNLDTLARAYTETSNSKELEKILPRLISHSGNSKRIKSSVNHCLDWLIKHYDTTAEEKALADMWKVYFAPLQESPELMQNYVHALIKHQQDTLAEQIITMQLDKQWDDNLIIEFGSLNIDNAKQRIKLAESWLDEHKYSAGLLLTLGRLSKKLKLWGKAKKYLESSLSRRPLAITYAELADLHEQLNETADAQRCAKKGLHIATRS